MRNLIVKAKPTEDDNHLNLLTIQAHVDDIYYSIETYPSDFSLSGNGTTPSTAATLVSLPIGNEVISVCQFTNGNTDEIKYLLRSFRYWEKGNLEFTVYYTGSTSNTNNIRFSLRGFTHSLDTSITAASTLSSDETTPGPATALFLKRYVFTTYLPFSREFDICNLRLYRESTHASDTYTGDVYLVMMKIRLIPSLMQTGTAF